MKTQISKPTLNYSRQLDKLIDSDHYAYSQYIETDYLTWVSYYRDREGLIHSSSFNYSIIGLKPVTVEEFEECIEREGGSKISFVSTK